MTREEALEAALRSLMDSSLAQTFCLSERCGRCQECAARAALAMPKDKPPPMFVGYDGSIWVNATRVADDARLLRVAEAVAEVQAQRAADYVNGVLGTDFLAGFGEHMRNTLDLAAIVEGVK